MSKADIPATEQTFEQKVNAVVAQMTTGDDGNAILPADLAVPEEIKYAAVLEKRRRDTQSAFSKAQERLRMLEIENEQLANTWSKETTSSLTAEQADELAVLKHENPDAWRVKLNEYEQANQEAFKAKRTDISKKAQTETELAKRQRLLAEFSEANPDLTLTDAVIADEIPPKFLKKLEKGEVTFEEFLTNCKDYLTKNKVIADNPAPDSVSLSKIPGSTRPDVNAVNNHIKTSYVNETY